MNKLKKIAIVLLMPACTQMFGGIGASSLRQSTLKFSHLHKVPAQQRVVSSQSCGVNVLDLSKCGLKDIYGIANFKVYMETLNNKIEMISLKEVPNLRLILSHNKLTGLPKDLGTLENLISLNLDNNQLTELRAEIGNLSNLHYLDLSRNQLIALPEEIGNLTELDTLYSDNNQLTTLPRSIDTLDKLVNVTFDPGLLDHFYSRHKYSFCR